MAYHKNYNQSVKLNEKLLFNIMPFFADESIDLFNTEYFPNGKSNRGVVKWHKYPNPFIENEVRGFFQYLAIEKKLAASYYRDFISTWDNTWSQFVTEKHPEMITIVDYDYQEIYSEYLLWLAENGYQTIFTRKMAQVTKDMEWLYFTQKCQSLDTFSQFYRYIESVVFPDTREERIKDIWDVRKLGIPFHTLPSRPRYTINYTGITQRWFKNIIKDYNFYRIQNREMATILDDMKAFCKFRLNGLPISLQTV